MQVPVSNFRLPENTKAKLRELAEREAKTMTSVIIDAIDALIERQAAADRNKGRTLPAR